MDDAQLVALIDQYIVDSETMGGSERETRRRKALDYLNGKVPDFPPQPGKSSVTSRDVADAMSFIVPGVAQVFLGSAVIGEYLPQTPKDEAFAAQATDYVNYLVLRECNGHAVLKTALHEALLLGNGVLKHWWDKSAKERVESFTGLDEEGVTAAISEIDDASAKVLDFEEYEDDQSPGQTRYDLKIKYVDARGELRVEAIADEDFLIERDARALTERECRFCAHKGRPTRSELIEQGYKRDVVDLIPSVSDSSVQSQSDRDGFSALRGDGVPHKASERVTIYECYVLVDYNGDGVAERRKIVTGGMSGKRQILANEEWGDDLPFTDLVPDPKPFSWMGRSIFDDMADVQEIKTVLLRKMLDNLYQVVEPQRAVSTDAIDEVGDVINLGPGGVVPVKGDARAAIADLTIPFVGKEAFAMLEYQDKVGERRVGSGPNSQGLDQDALQNQTARAVEATQSALATRKEDYAANIAQVGLKRFFKCLLRLVVKNQDKPRTVRLRKQQWVAVDPRPWNVDMDVEINTGLGTGSRDRDLQTLNGVATKQEQVVLRLGPSNPLLGLDKLFVTYRKMAEAAGLRNAEAYFPEIDPQQLAQFAQSMQQPDPKAIEAQQRMQIEQQKALADHDLQQKKLAAQLQNDRERHAMELQAQREKQEMEFQLEIRAQDHKFALREREMEFEARLAAQANVLAAQNHAGQTDTNIERPQ